MNSGTSSKIISSIPNLSATLCTKVTESHQSLGLWLILLWSVGYILMWALNQPRILWLIVCYLREPTCQDLGNHCSDCDSEWLLFRKYHINCPVQIHLRFLVPLMDSPSAWYQVCACGRTFGVLQAYSYHKRSCQKTKKRLASALEKVKEVWEAKKRRKIEEKITMPVKDDFSNRDTVPESTRDGDVDIVPGVYAEVRFNILYMRSMLRTIYFPGNCRCASCPREPSWVNCGAQAAPRESPIA